MTMKEVDDCLVSSSHLWRPYNVPNRTVFSKISKDFVHRLGWFQLIFGLCVMKSWSKCMLEGVHLTGLKLRNQYKSLTLVGTLDRYTLLFLLFFWVSITVSSLKLFPNLLECLLQLEYRCSLVKCLVLHRVCTSLPTLLHCTRCRKLLESGLRSRTMMAVICIALCRVKS